MLTHRELKDRAVKAVATLQHRSVDLRMDQITMEEIDAEIQVVRKKRTARGAK